jgi:hypothetical protein
MIHLWNNSFVYFGYSDSTACGVAAFPLPWIFIIDCVNLGSFAVGGLGLVSGSHIA